MESLARARPEENRIVHLAGTGELMKMRRNVEKEREIGEEGRKAGIYRSVVEEVKMRNEKRRRDMVLRRKKRRFILKLALHDAALDDVLLDGTTLDDVLLDGAALDDILLDGAALNDVLLERTALDDMLCHFADFGS